MAGYSTCSRKMTQNKLLEGVARPEVVDDWDQKMLVTTLLVERGARKITLLQDAEKDQVSNIVRCFFWTCLQTGMQCGQQDYLYSA